MKNTSKSEISLAATAKTTAVKRESNFELLRIVGMFGIVLGHSLAGVLNLVALGLFTVCIVTELVRKEAVAKISAVIQKARPRVWNS